MTTTFRLVHFVPDPYTGGRWPVAALLERGGAPVVVRALALPGPASLGSTHAHATCELVLQSLRHVAHPSRLPAEVGTCVELGPETRVPPGVDDPAAWLQETVLPTPLPANGEPTRPRPPRRTRYGEQFLRRWNVDRYVRSRFVAGEHVPELRTPDGDRLPNVSQWVKGASQVLLLEPLAPVRPDVVEEARKVWQQFASYAYAFEHGHVDPPLPRMLAYVLGGGDRAARSEALTAARADSWEVVDTESEIDRNRFIELIRTTGESGAGRPGSLFPPTWRLGSTA